MSAIMKGGKNSLSMYRANILIFFAWLPNLAVRCLDNSIGVIILSLLVDLCRKNLHYLI